MPIYEGLLFFTSLAANIVTRCRCVRGYFRSIFFGMGATALKNKLHSLLVVVLFALLPSLWAQKSQVPVPAPVPVQIQTGKKIFISNAGGESLEAVDVTVFSGGPDRPYNQFYAAMKELKRYELVPSPADADLVFQVSWTLTDTGLRLPVLGQLRVVIVDPKTHITLWSFAEHVRGALLQGNRDKNFDWAMNSIVNRIKATGEILTGATTVRQDSPR